MHTCICPGNWLATGRADVYHTGDAHAFSSGMKCRHVGVASTRLEWKHSLNPYQNIFLTAYLHFYNVQLKSRLGMQKGCLRFGQVNVCTALKN